MNRFEAEPFLNSAEFFWLGLLFLLILLSSDEISSGTTYFDSSSVYSVIDRGVSLVKAIKSPYCRPSEESKSYDFFLAFYWL